MTTQSITEARLDTVVVGGGQSGLAMGYYLARQSRDFVILDAGNRVGDAWRSRWDSLRLFTPAFHSSLPGMPFPAPGRSFPTKDETADYLETYARSFDLPVRLGRWVGSLSRHDGGYLVQAGDERYLADRVVVATGAYAHPHFPECSKSLHPGIAQLHSSSYRSPRHLPEGSALVVGAGNSGAEIAVELAATRHTYLAGRDTGHVPLPLVHNRLSLWLAEHLLTLDTRLGHKLRENHGHGGDPLIRLSQGISGLRVSSGYRESRASSRASPFSRMDGSWTCPSWSGRPVSGRTSAGLRSRIFDRTGYPDHHRGIVASAPGLFFLGLPFQHSFTSTHIGGVGRDARFLAET